MQEVTRASVQGPQAPAAARTVPSTAGTANGKHLLEQHAALFRAAVEQQDGQVN